MIQTFFFSDKTFGKCEIRGTSGLLELKYIHLGQQYYDRSDGELPSHRDSKNIHSFCVAIVTFLFSNEMLLQMR